MWKHKISFVGRREESNKESRGFKLGREIKKGVGINDLEFGGHGVGHFGISKRKGAQMFMPPMAWYGNFLESPNLFFLT